MTRYHFTKVSDLSFEFITTHGAIYRAYFIGYGYLFTDYPEIANDIYSFNLDTLTEDSASFSQDEKIGQTIAAIFHDFFTTRHNVAVYICDTSDDKQQARKRKFDFWFWKYNDGSIIKEDGFAVAGGIELYNSLLFHRENKLAGEIIAAFRTLNERGDEK